LPPCIGKMVRWSLLIQSIKISPVCLDTHSLFPSPHQILLHSWNFILSFFTCFCYFFLFLTHCLNFDTFVFISFCTFYFFLYFCISSTYLFVYFRFILSRMHKLSIFCIFISIVLINSFVLFFHLLKQTLSLKVEMFASEICLEYSNIPTT
jgi:hypothetical protein